MHHSQHFFLVILRDVLKELLSKRDIILNDKGKIEKVIKEHLLCVDWIHMLSASDGCFEHVSLFAGPKLL